MLHLPLAHWQKVCISAGIISTERSEQKKTQGNVSREAPTSPQGDIPCRRQWDASWPEAAPCQGAMQGCHGSGDELGIKGGPVQAGPSLRDAAPRG